MSDPVACCDIGGTKILLGIIDQDSAIVAKDKYLVGDKRDPRALVAELAARLDSLLEEAGLSRREVAGLGCSMAGMIDLERGFVYSAPALGWRDVGLKDALEEALGLPVVVEMDAYAMALGEAQRGAGVGRQHLVGIVVGTGIGAGLILDGRPYHGCRGLAGEFGHMILVPDGPRCNCGRYGCLEALASGTAIAARAQGALEQGRATLIGELAAECPSGVTSEVVFAAARRADRVALTVIDEAARYLGIGIANLITLLSVDTVILGGGVGHGGADLLMPRLTAVVDPHLEYWTRALDVQISVGALGEDAALIGASGAMRMALDP